MSADSLYDNIRGYLRLTARVVSKEGEDFINEGEDFTIRFTGSNGAYSAGKVDRPRIIFLKPRIYVEGTEYAIAKAGNKWYSLPDTVLRPGESSYVEVVFEAKMSMGGFFDQFVSENVAKAWIKADLDQSKFFEIWNYKDIFEEITPS